MPDHEPPMPPPMHPPPPSPPSRAAVAIVAKHMSTAKKSRKKVYLTPEEALDRLLAEQERKKGKATKKLVTQARAKLAIRDRATLAIRDRDEEELETQPPVAKPKIAQVVSTGLVKKKLKTKRAGASGSQRRKKYA